LPPACLYEVFDVPDGIRWGELYTAWGGIPRYWELAQEEGGDVVSQVDRFVLDPLGPLHREPDRLLLEEIPSALETRPVLDAIGSGAHRVSEIAGRLGRPATSMARPLDRLIGLGLVRRELPFGEDEKGSKRGLYKIADPFTRLWFRVVAPYRAQLASGTSAARRQILARFWDSLCAQSWEELCRHQVPRLPAERSLGQLGPWGPASRWWHGAEPEWDLLSESLDGRRLLLGEVKWSARPFNPANLEKALRELNAKPTPPLPSRLAGAQIVRALFVPTAAFKGYAAKVPDGLMVLTAADLLEI
jgi:AAA+ ATPase superfamily predicted ATPase